MPSLKHTSPSSEREGSLLIDALLSIVIFAIITTGFVTGISQGGLRGTVSSADRARAAYLAEEGIEAIRSIRDRDGFSTISARALSQDDGVQLTSGAGWTIVDEPTVIDGTYTRAVQFFSGADQYGRVVQTTVTWDSLGSTASGSISMRSYISKWNEPPPPPPPDWTTPILRSAFNDLAFDEPSIDQLAVSGSYAYLTARGDFSGGYGLFIVDISNISSPSLANSVWVNGGWVDVYDVALYGHYAYLVSNDSSNEIFIMYVTNPATANCNPCASSINVAGSSQINSIAISGTGLILGSDTDGASAEIIVYDVEDNRTSPTLVSSIEPPSSRNIYSVTATGGTAGAPYVYAGTSHTTDELTVASITGSTVTGEADASGSSQQGRSVAVINDNAFLGIKNNTCEVFGFDNAGKVHDPNVSASCGTGPYDAGGDNTMSEEASGLAASQAATLAFPHLFASTDTQKSGVNYYLHIFNATDESALNSNVLYNGSAMTAGYGADNDIFYRESDHTLFMVGGDGFVTSHLLIIQPTYSY